MSARYKPLVNSKKSNDFKGNVSKKNISSTDETINSACNYILNDDNKYKNIFTIVNSRLHYSEIASSRL